MEHLIFTPGESSARDLQYVWENSTLEGNSQQDEVMDFVPSKVPWLGFNHDAKMVQKFKAYPRAHGFDTEKLWNAEFRDAHIELKSLTGEEISSRVAALFQAWLYFGLLESILEDKKIKASYLTRQDSDGQTYMFSRNLYYCLRSIIINIRLSSKERKAEVNHEIQTTLGHVHDWTLRFAAWSHTSFRPKLEGDYPRLMSSIEETVPVIARLAEAIAQARLHALADYPTYGTLEFKYPWNIIEKRSIELRKLGWCPFQICMLQNTVNQSTMDWLVAIKVSQEPVGHETCTPEACSRNNIDNSTYQQAHVCSNQQCQKLRPNLEAVLQTLRNGNIPVMSLDMSNPDRSKLVVHGTSKSTPGHYTAISHVWADGLGGKTEEGLNQCQAQRISRLCKAVSTTNKFWVDSLCIPRSDKEVYYMALDAIRYVYQNASTTLVLDRTVQRCTISSSTEELYAHIYLSAWMQRMWTYEEAVLSKKLVFQLGDDTFHTYKIDTRPKMPPVISVVWQSLATQLYRLRVAHESINIGQIYLAFRYRLTNVPQEEFLSISGMLGLDTQRLMRVKGHERTKAFWLMLKRVPFNVPFLDGSKLEIVGFRWAPSTMMHPTPTSLDAESGGFTVECREQGLFGTWLTVNLGTRLTGKSENSGSIFYVFMNEGTVRVPENLDNTRTCPAMVLRLYCTEVWRSIPTGLFDTVLLPSETRSVMRPGEFVAGVALLSDSRTNKSITAQTNYDGISRPSSTAEPTCAGTTPRFRFVARLLAERLTDQEVSNSTSTVMFEGSNNVKIHSDGFWSADEICVT